jgi:putative tricarboxylic transport membrane protein
MLERVVGLVVAVAAGMYLTLAMALPYGTTARPGPGFFPLLVGIFGCVVGLAMSVRAFRAPVQAPATPKGTRDAAARNRALSTVIGLVAFCLLMPWIGYPLVAFGFVTVMLQRLGSSWRRAVITGALTAVVSFYVFGVLLDVPLPNGPW